MSIILDNQKRLDELKKILKLNSKEIKILNKPVQIKKFNICIAKKKYLAWRVIYNNALGPGKGGIRFHPDVSQDEVQSLAFWMSLKTALVNLPYGGAKGGVRVNPKNLSQLEIENLSRAYIKAFYKYLGQDKDIPAPDVYTNSEVMAWMLDEYEKIKEAHEPAMITGKPIELGGIAMRQDATAQGAYIINKQIAKQFFKVKNRNIKIVIQGFGNAGSYLAKKLVNDGFLIIAVSDSQGGVFNENGLNIDKLIKFKEKTGYLKNFPNSKNINNHQLLNLKTDILALAALENQITEINANEIQAKYILELANGPINYKADKILDKKKIIIIPDILTNAGGVIASHFEGMQNKIGQVLDEKYLKDLLAQKMIFAWQEVFNLYQKYKGNISLRQSAYIIAILRILKAEKLRGRLK